METKTCYRCKRNGRPFEHPLSDFYKDREGKPLATCRVCRRELAASYHKRVQEEEHGRLPKGDALRYPVGILARTSVTQGVPYGPKIVVWRCASCYRRSITRAKGGSETPKLPGAWKSMALRLFGGRNEPVILCGPCFTVLARAQKVLARVTTRLEKEKETAYATNENSSKH
jgi:uncharacterized CHY-type Zn-finger protein